MGELLFRHMTIKGAKRLSERRDGKGQTAAYLKGYLPEAKRILESEYGIRMMNMPRVFVSMPLKVHRSKMHRLIYIINPYRVFDQSYNALQVGATYNDDIESICVSSFRVSLLRMFFNKDACQTILKRSILHELTHYVLFSMGAGICSAKDIPRKIVHEGLCEYSKGFLQEELENPKNTAEKAGRWLHKAIYCIISWQDNLKGIYLKAISRKRREILISRNPERWLAFRMKYRLGIEFVRELAKEFNDNGKLFRHVMDMAPLSMEEILDPGKYIEKINRQI